MAEQDVLDADAFAEHEGGFAAAAAALGAKPALYHPDTARAGVTRVRTVAEEIARVLRGRAANPRWIEGQMRHGHRGAAEIAESVDNLFAWRRDRRLVQDVTSTCCSTPPAATSACARFLDDGNPAAAAAIAQPLRRGDHGAACGARGATADPADMLAKPPTAPRSVPR